MELNQLTDSAHTLILTVALLGSLAWLPRPSFLRKKKLTSAAGMSLTVNCRRIHKRRHAPRETEIKKQAPRVGPGSSTAGED